MKEIIDWVVTIASLPALGYAVVDAILNGFQPMPIAISLLLAVVVICLHVIKAITKRKEKAIPEKRHNTRQHSVWDASRLKMNVRICRILIVLALFAIVGTVFLYRSIPSLTLNVDRLQEFEIVRGSFRTVYTTAGTHNGIVVYGRGQHLLVSLGNTSTLPLDIISVEIVLENYIKDHLPDLIYSALKIAIPNTRLPIESITTPVQWIESDRPGTVKAIGKGRIRLDAKGQESDIHQIAFTVEAKASGLWIYSLRVRYIEPKTNQSIEQRSSQEFAVLLRGR